MDKALLESIFILSAKCAIMYADSAAPKNKGEEEMKRETKKKKRKLNYKRVILLSVLIIIFMVVGATAGLLAGAVKQIPQAIEPTPDASTFIYDANNNLITQLHAGENRVPVKLSEISKYLQYATIAVEDERFYKHHGIDIKRIFGALLVDLKTMSKAQGASTITQQLARNAFLTQKKEWSRKIKEAILAIQLEQKYSKEQILEFYLNQIYYGHGANGIELAAQIYFGKHAKDLDLAESALLAGIPKGPGYYSPYVDLEKSVSRRNLILDLMAEQGYITPSQAEKAKQEKVELVGLKEKVTTAPYFVDYVVQQLGDMGFTTDDIYRGGLRVYTTLDLKMQKYAEQTVNEYFSEGVLKGEVDAKGIVQPQVALLTIDPKNGYIKAMVGGRNYNETKFNRTVQAVRQPGSAFKPFVYITALQQGFTPGTIVVDEPVNFNGWTPKNYDGKYRGPVTLSHGLYDSLNTIAAKLINQVGPDSVIATAEKMGISTFVKSGNKSDRNLAIALGGLTKGAKIIDMTRAYGAIANEGIMAAPIAVLRVEDSNGNLLKENSIQRKEVLDQQTSFLITSMMQNVVKYGTGRRANLGRPIAGKTGTTDDNNDAWFIGFTPDLVTSVWIGMDNRQENSYMKRNKITSSYPTRVWASYMGKVLKDIPVSNFVKPSGITGPISVSDITGKLASPLCPPEKLISLFFLSGTEPTEMCDLHNEQLPQDGELLPGNGIIPDDETPSNNGENPPDTENNPSSPATGENTSNSDGNNANNGQAQTPKEYVYVLVDIDTGYLATENCPNTKLRKYVKGTQPTEYCPEHR